jgi:hypothetical protein
MSEIGLLGESMVVDADFSQAEPSIVITMVNWIDTNFYSFTSETGPGLIIQSVITWLIVQAEEFGTD